MSHSLHGQLMCHVHTGMTEDLKYGHLMEPVMLGLEGMWRDMHEITPRKLRVQRAQREVVLADVRRCALSPAPCVCPLQLPRSIISSQMATMWYNGMLLRESPIRPQAAHRAWSVLTGE